MDGHLENQSRSTFSIATAPYVRMVKHKSQNLIMAGDLTMPGTVNSHDVSATESTYLELD
jgi:hypothetical protein